MSWFRHSRRLFFADLAPLCGHPGAQTDGWPAVSRGLPVCSGVSGLPPSLEDERAREGRARAVLQLVRKRDASLPLALCGLEPVTGSLARGETGQSQPVLQEEDSAVLLTARCLYHVPPRSVDK